MNKNHANTKGRSTKKSIGLPPVELSCDILDLIDESNTIITRFIKALNLDEQISILLEVIQADSINVAMGTFLVNLYLEMENKHPLKCFLVRHITKATSIKETFITILSDVIRRYVLSNNIEYARAECIVSQLCGSLDNPLGVAALKEVRVELAFYLLSALTCFDKLRKSNTLSPTEKTKLHTLFHTTLRLLLHIIQNQPDSRLTSILPDIRAITVQLLLDNNFPMDTKSVCGILYLMILKIKCGPDAWLDILHPPTAIEDTTLTQLLNNSAASLALHSAIITAVPKDSLLSHTVEGENCLVAVTKRLIEVADRNSTNTTFLVGVSRAILQVSKALDDTIDQEIGAALSVLVASSSPGRLSCEAARTTAARALAAAVRYAAVHGPSSTLNDIFSILPPAPSRAYYVAITALARALCSIHRCIPGIKDQCSPGTKELNVMCVNAVPGALRSLNLQHVQASAAQALEAILDLHLHNSSIEDIRHVWIEPIITLSVEGSAGGVLETLLTKAVICLPELTRFILPHTKLSPNANLPCVLMLVNVLRCAGAGSTLEGSKHEGNKHEGSKHEGNKHEGNKHEGNKHEGSKHEGNKHEGNKHEGNKHEGNKHEGNKHEGNKHEGNKHEGSKHEGNKHEGNKHEGNKHEGNKHEGSKHEGNKHEGNKHEGNKHEGNKHEGNKHEGNKHEGNKHEGNKHEGNKHEGNKHEGNKHEGNKHEGNKHEGNKHEGNKHEGNKHEGNKHEGSKHEGNKHEGNKHEGNKHEGNKHEGSKHEGNKHEGNKHEGSKHEGSKLWRGLVGYDVLKRAAVDERDETRILALSLVVENQKSTEPFTEDEVDFILYFVEYNINAQSASFRQQMLALIKKFVKRVSASTADVRSLHSLRRRVRRGARGGNRGRRGGALEVLALTAGTHSEWTESFVEEMLFHLEDGYEQNKILALKVLETCPAEVLKSETFAKALDLETIFQQAMSRKPIDCVSAAYKLELVMKKLPENILKGEPSDTPCPVSHRTLSDLLALATPLVTSPTGRHAPAPLYGLVHCMGHVLTRVDAGAISSDPRWSSLVSSLISFCFDVTAVMAVVVNNSSPEGFLPCDWSVVEAHDDFSCSALENGVVVTAQMVLLCAWRAVKEVSLLLGEMCARLSVSGESVAGGTLGSRQMALIGEHFTRLLTETKHRGAFEQAYVGFTKLLTRLSSCKQPSLHALPRAWLSRTVHALREGSGALCATRRGAGVPYIVQAILTCTSDPTLLDSTMTQLLSESTTQPQTDHTTNLFDHLSNDQLTKQCDQTNENMVNQYHDDKSINFPNINLNTLSKSSDLNKESLDKLTDELQLSHDQSTDFTQLSHGKSTYSHKISLNTSTDVSNQSLNDLTDINRLSHHKSTEDSDQSHDKSSDVSTQSQNKLTDIDQQSHHKSTDCPDPSHNKCTNSSIIRSLCDNTLRALYRDTTLGPAVGPFVAAGLMRAIDGFDASTWMERNSSTLLFSAIMVRVFGVPRAAGSGAGGCGAAGSGAGGRGVNAARKDHMTARTFFARYPELYDYLLSKLSLTSRGLPPTLLVLGRLQPAPAEGGGGVDSHLKLSSFVRPLVRTAQSEQHSTRRLAAAAITPLIQKDRYASHLEEMLHLLANRSIKRNFCHGILLQLTRLVYAKPDIEISIETERSLSDALSNTLWILTQATEKQPCYVITEEYVKMVNMIIWRFGSLLQQEFIANLLTYLDRLLFNGYTPPVTSGMEVCLATSLHSFLVILHVYSKCQHICDLINKTLQHKSYEVVLSALNYLLILHGEYEIDNKCDEHLSIVADKSILNKLNSNEMYKQTLCSVLKSEYLECVYKALKVLVLEKNTQKLIVEAKVSYQNVSDQLVIDSLIDFVRNEHENLTHVYLKSLLDYITIKFKDDSISNNTIMSIINLVYEYSSSDNSEEVRLEVVDFLKVNAKRLLEIVEGFVQPNIQFEYKATLWATLITLLEDDERTIRQSASRAIRPGDVIASLAARAALRALAEGGGGGALLITVALLDFRSRVCFSEDISDECRVFDQNEKYNTHLEEAIWTEACLTELKQRYADTEDVINIVLNIINDPTYSTTIDKLCKPNVVDFQNKTGYAYEFLKRVSE